MRRADYLALAEILGRAREDMARALVNATDDAQRQVAHARAAQTADIARDFARRAQLGGMKPAEFLTLAGL